MKEYIAAIVLLSGPIAVGKTSVREELLSSYGYDYVRSSAYLRELLTTQLYSDKRTSLQDLGDSLDIETDYRWLLDSVANPGFAASPEQKHWLVDAVRKQRQISHFREAYGPVVLHVHLTAPEDVLQQRYASRLPGSGDSTPYAVAIQHENEIASRSLIDVADLVLDASTSAPRRLADAIAVAAGKL